MYNMFCFTEFNLWQDTIASDVVGIVVELELALSAVYRTMDNHFAHIGHKQLGQLRIGQAEHIRYVYIFFLDRSLYSPKTERIRIR